MSHIEVRSASGRDGVSPSSIFSALAATDAGLTTRELGLMLGMGETRPKGLLGVLESDGAIERVGSRPSRWRLTDTGRELHRLGELFDVRAAAQRLGTAGVWVYDRILAGELPAMRIGGRWYISETNLGKLGDIEGPSAPARDRVPPSSIISALAAAGAGLTTRELGSRGTRVGKTHPRRLQCPLGVLERDGVVARVGSRPARWQLTDTGQGMAQRGELWGVRAAAERVGMSRGWVNSRILTGELPAMRIGTRWVIAERDLNELCDSPATSSGRTTQDHGAIKGWSVGGVSGDDVVPAGRNRRKWRAIQSRRPEILAWVGEGMSVAGIASRLADVPVSEYMVGVFLDEIGARPPAAPRNGKTWRALQSRRPEILAWIDEGMSVAGIASRLAGDLSMSVSHTTVRAFLGETGARPIGKQGRAPKRRALDDQRAEILAWIDEGLSFTKIRARLAAGGSSVSSYALRAFLDGIGSQPRDAADALSEVLVCIASAARSLTAHEIAEITESPYRSVLERVRCLERLGLVHRGRPPGKHASYVCGITAAGLASLGEGSSSSTAPSSPPPGQNRDGN